MEKSPDAFRTISEAAQELDLPQHVLRFWETRFPTIKPLKRGGGRRYYRPEDVLLLKGIRHLLYEQGFTIKGVQKILKEQGVRHVVALGNAGVAPDDYREPFEEDEESEGENPQAALPATPSPRTDPDEPVLSAFEPAVPAMGQRRSGLSEDDREKLSKVLRELLDCKRILERARDT